MGIQIGQIIANKLYIGGVEVTKVYQGTALVYESNPEINYELTISITGLPESYEVAVDNVVWPGNKKAFPAGTILQDLVVTVTGYTIAPTTTAQIIMDSNKTLSLTATAIPTGRKWSLDIGGQFSTSPVEAGITWNTWKATNAQLAIVEGYTLSNLKTEANANSTLSVTNSGVFAGSSNVYITYSSTSPVYPKVAVESGINLQNPTGFKFTGADPAKTYKISFLCATSTVGDSKTTISFGAQSATKAAQNNLPIDGESRYTSSALVSLTGVTPDGSGTFTIGVQRGGAYFTTVVNLILIQEE